MQFLYHPDTVLTAADLETLAVSLLAWLPLPGVEGDTFDPEVIWRTVTRASVRQKSTKAVTDNSLKTYSDDYTLTQLHTIPATTLEEIVNGLLAQQAAMIRLRRYPLSRPSLQGTCRALLDDTSRWHDQVPPIEVADSSLSPTVFLRRRAVWVVKRANFWFNILLSLL